VLDLVSEQSTSSVSSALSLAGVSSALCNPPASAATVSACLWHKRARALRRRRLWLRTVVRNEEAGTFLNIARCMMRGQAFCCHPAVAITKLMYCARVGDNGAPGWSWDAEPLELLHPRTGLRPAPAPTAAALPRLKVPHRLAEDSTCCAEDAKSPRNTAAA